MADENIMSLIQNLFVDDNNGFDNSQLIYEKKLANYPTENLMGGNFAKGNLENELNSKKLLLRQLSNQQQQNVTSFYNDVTTNNALLGGLTMKENELDLNEELVFSNKMFPLNGQLSKANYDLINNTTPTNAQLPHTTVVEQRQTTVIKDLPISPLSDCSFKSNLLTTSNHLNKPQSQATPNNLYGNFSLINNANSVLLSNNSSLVSTTSNLLTNNLIQSPVISNTSNNNLSHSGGSTVNSFADIILGCDDGVGQNFNNYGLNNVVQRTVAQQFANEQNKLVDSCASPDSFVYTEEDRFESQIRSLANEIHSTIQLHMNGLHMRREGLLQQLEHIKKVYLDVLRKKKAALNGNKQPLFNKQDQTNLKQLEKFVLPSIMFNKPDSAIYKAISQLGFLNTPAFGPFCTASGDGLEFAVPGVNSTFTIETRNCFNDELLVGRESISIEILALFNDNPQTAFNTGGDMLMDGTQMQSTNNTNLELNVSGTKSNIKKSNPSLLDYTSKSVIPHTFFDHNNGKYTITYNVPMLMKSIPQELVIKISVNSLPINDSPMRVPVQTQKRQNWKLATTFGSEGNSVGNLCRPWGVAIVKMPSQLLMNHQNNSLISQQVNGQLTNELQQQIMIDTVSSSNSSNNGLNQQQQQTNQNAAFAQSPNNLSSLDIKQSAEQHYLIGIADRSNNRIQLLDYNSKTQQTNVINVFGSGPGTRAGMFDRPAGICINLGLGHIIVADKDNHRIQVFSLTGRYLFKFGEKGNRIGSFQCPWDVDSCANSHQIAVSDTRNRRIQLFTPYGQYINHFSLLMDSPRGVCFLPDKRLVVSDFNKHRILIFDKFICDPNMGKDSGFTNLNSPKIVSFGEGSAWGEFLRPQGVSVSGNSIFCADSRNNRICIYNMLTQTFEYLSEELGLDRPSDLSVIDDNLLVIMDFGNNRLQILQR